MKTDQRLVGILLSATVFFGCSKNTEFREENKTMPSKEATVHVESVKPLDQKCTEKENCFSLKESIENPYLYNLQMSFQDTSSEKILEIREVDFSIKDSSWITYNNDIWLKHKTKYLVNIFNSIGGKAGEKIDAFEVTTPKDFVLDSRLVYDQEYLKNLKEEGIGTFAAGKQTHFVLLKDVSIKSHRFLFLTKDSSLYTDGKKIKVESDFAFLQENTITSFVKYIQEKVPQSGGSVYMSFTSATGKLSIILRGQNGENGPDGQDLSTTRARDANFGECQRIYDTYEMHGSFVTVAIGATFKNSVFAENGKRGGNAGRGYDGGYGGDIYFQIQNNQGFNLTAKSEPGLGGKMGKVGLGQKGGLPQGPVDCFGNIVEGLPGGTDGPPGFPTQDGEDGKRGIVKISLGQQKIENN